jgi:hypothetical protein
VTIEVTGSEELRKIFMALRKLRPCPLQAEAPDGRSRQLAKFGPSADVALNSIRLAVAAGLGLISHGSN